MKSTSVPGGSLIDPDLRWRSESQDPRPVRAQAIGDNTTADGALARAREGAFLLYRGDMRNLRQLYAAMARRLEVRRRKRRPPRQASLAELFRAERQSQEEEHRVLSRLLVTLEPAYTLQLERAPDVREACEFAWGPACGDGNLVSFRELLGILGAAEWRRKGLFVAALGERLFPHWGVFSPVRQEHVELVAQAPFPEGARVFDVGTGTGVLALVAAKRGARQVVATDVEPRAVSCARANVERLGLLDRVLVEEADLFPAGRANLIIANPPWIPETPRGPLDRAVYDPGGHLLARLVGGLSEHLETNGEAWLVLSDLPERLGLRPEGWLAGLFSTAKLTVRWTRSSSARHPRAARTDDPLHGARSKEQVTLYCLAC